MNVTVNGAPQDLPEGATVTEVLPEEDAQGRLGVAVALNGEVVRRAEWATTHVKPGDKIEILRAVGGG